jgi:hypothetical protein
MGRRTPRYQELPRLPDRDERYAWDVWGRDDELGTLNLIGPEERLAAARLVESGEMIGLNLPLDEPKPGLFSGRAYEQVIEVTRDGLNDHLDNFHLQFSTQWDGLRHIRAGKSGFWGGRQQPDIDSGALGIDRWADHGFGGRGVLLDVARHLAMTGRPLAPDLPFAIDAALLSEVAAAQGTTVCSGDILLVRTGWIDFYRALPAERRAALLGTVGAGFACPGLDSSREMAAYLWDSELAAAAADNPALEVLPVDRGKGFLHKRLIPLQGMPIGELWSLDVLAQSCAVRGRWEFLLICGLLRLPGGVGSPANAYALLLAFVKYRKGSHYARVGHRRHRNDQQGHREVAVPPWGPGDVLQPRDTPRRTP